MNSHDNEPKGISIRLRMTPSRTLSAVTTAPKTIKQSNTTA
jgi:hypothetical protein